MRLIVFGGGCWGHHHTAGLLKAKAAGRATFEGVHVVDKQPSHRVYEAFCGHPDVTFETADWASFLDAYVGTDRMGPHDRLVPAPIAPHLFMDWLLSRLRRAIPDLRWAARALNEPIGTPFEAVGAQGERFVSYAEWRCPPNCIEPKRCPAIRSPRTWEMPDTVRALQERFQAQGVEVFHSRHFAWGIAALPAFDLQRAHERIVALTNREAGGDFIVGTVSACHGVVGCLSARLERQDPPRSPQRGSG